ncbi:alpha-L-rhamnosidase C-terminal domain-containing protein [Microbacterium sp. SYP-A9085]|uniref:alpha-L-rhamnosidase C-terminal domain-containing protein n=1 Tax=Microbacterium sp. SYP-A9085 TaxID=2664454 RepID=UPI003464DDE0
MPAHRDRRERHRARHDCPYGTISCEWTIAESGMTTTVRLPGGTTGRVILPDGTATDVGPGVHTFTCPASQ